MTDDPTQPTRPATDAHASRILSRAIPWVASVALHIIVLLLGMVIVWSVTYARDRHHSPVSASFDAPAIASFFDPADASRDELAPIEAPQPTPLRTPDPPTPINTPADAPPLLTAGSPSLDLPSAEPAHDDGVVRFAGTSSQGAARICYLLDASGSMRLRLPVIIDELMRSIDRLDDDQRFMLILFQNDEAILPSFSGSRPKLLAPTREHTEQLVRWLDTVIARGRSNPIKAIEQAVALRPDTIFILSNNITGSGQFELSQNELLAALDRLNPKNQRTGRREIVINTIQFVDPDPLDTLKRIAQEHGSGPDSYNFISRAELGLR
ncbi:MAG: VWA domain-containing protein [Phycisphaerales bacterium]|nr:VWA domain-containing protein [Phycisphaerales bacterium]